MKHVTVLTDGTRISLDGMWGVCPKCKRLLPMFKIGMRRMSRVGLIRRQPYCKHDRNV